MGAEIMVSSILPYRKSTARRTAIGEDDHLEKPLEISRREADIQDLPNVKQVPKARRATRAFGADKFEGREADLEKAARVNREEPVKSTAEERRLRDWAERLAGGGGVLLATEGKVRREQE